MSRRLGLICALVSLAFGCGSNAPAYTPFAIGGDATVPPGDVGTGADGQLTTPGDDAVAATDGASTGGGDGTSASDTSAADGAGAADGGATVTDGGSTDPQDGGGVQDSGAQDAGVQDSGVKDSGVQDTGVKDTGTWAAPDTGQPEDVPWGSSADAKPFDAGPINYGDVKNTGGNTGSGGAGLCTPKISQLPLEEIKKGGQVDIIWWIDTSGSMGQEAKYLNQNLNSFANFIAGSAIDYRVVLIGKSIGSIQVCVGPPLGGPGCSGGPTFLPVKEYISSKNGLQRVVQTYPKWKSFLRKGAVKNFVAVTDDNSYGQYNANWFISQLQNLDATMFQKTQDVQHGFIFHSIVGYPNKSQCSTLASVGTIYLDLTAKTKGEKFKICETNWAPIFQKLAKSVVENVKPPCTHKIPLPLGVKSAEGVTVNYVAQDDFFNVPPAKGNICPASGVGYTLDNPADPKKITLCNKSCDLLKGGGNIQFDFGCFL